MSSRPRPPLRALVLTGAAAIAAGVGVAALLIATSGAKRTTARGPYQPFRAGAASTLEAEIHTAPVFFSDPQRGTRAFYLDDIDGRIVALHVLSEGRPRCPVAFDRTRHRYEDCDRHPVDPHTLERFAVLVHGIGDSRVVDVDLRSVLPPLAAHAVP